MNGFYFIQRACFLLMITGKQSVQKPTLMKTQFDDAIKYLIIKVPTFQQHDLVLKLSNKMFGYLMTS